MIEGIPMPDARLYVLDDAEAVGREAARRFASAAARAVDGCADLRVALCGGRTPLIAYRLLAGDDTFRHSVHWPSVEFFWGDERVVPADDADSNFGTARKLLLAPLGIAPERIHPVPTESGDAERAASAYEDVLGRAFGLAGSGVPRFDLVLLGLGADGHTASLFPGEIPDSIDRLAVATRRPVDGSPRVTLTPTVLNAAREVLFLVTGGEKAVALEHAMRAEAPDPSVPGSLIRPTAGKITWLADRTAAANVVQPAGGDEGDS